MQPLQCVFQHLVANLHVSTHMATKRDNNHVAIPLRSATTDSKTPYITTYAQAHPKQLEATIAVRQKKGKPTAAATAAHRRYLSSPAATTLHGKTQGFVLRLLPQHKPHATFMQPSQCVLQHDVANPRVSTHMATKHDNNHVAIPLRSATADSKTPYITTYAQAHPKQLEATVAVRQKKRQTDLSRNRCTQEVPFIAGCNHFTRKNTRFRAPASSPTQAPCNVHAAITMHSATFPSSPLPFVTTSLPHHFPSSPLPLVTTLPSSPLPLVTTSQSHHFPSSPFPKSPLPFLTTSQSHHFPSSPLPSVTTSISHHFPKSPHSLRHHFPKSPHSLVTTSLRHHFP